MALIKEKPNYMSEEQYQMVKEVMSVPKFCYPKLTKDPMVNNFVDHILDEEQELWPELSEEDKNIYQEEAEELVE